jgi:fatty acyl-CoA reductase
MTSTLQQFYAGLVIFITGGTGFLGKLLLLKLLQSCLDIGGIIILLGEKRGQSCQERLFNILLSPVGVTCVTLPIETPIIFSFFRNCLT